MIMVEGRIEVRSEPNTYPRRYTPITRHRAEERREVTTATHKTPLRWSLLRQRTSIQRLYTLQHFWHIARINLRHPLFRYSIVEHLTAPIVNDQALHHFA